MAGTLEKMSIASLFERMFDLEREGLIAEAQVVRSFIEAQIKGNDVYVLMYIKTIKEKPVYRNLLKIFKGEDLKDFELCLFITSMITHQLLEAKRHGIEAYFALRVEAQTDLLSRYQKGLVQEEHVNEFYREFFKEIFNTESLI